MDGELVLQQLPQGDDGNLRRGKAQHDGVADRLDELVAGSEHGKGTVAKPPHDGHRLDVPVGFGHCGEPGEIDEGKRRLDGLFGRR